MREFAGLTSILIWMAIASPVSAQTEPVAVDFCQTRNPLRFCVQLYDRLAPTTTMQSAVYNSVVLNEASTLLPYSFLGTRLQRAALPTGRLAIHRRRINSPANEYVIWCTASVLSDDYILTAAHCIPGPDSEEFVTRAHLRMGYVDDRNPNDPEGTVVYPVIGDPDGCRPRDPDGAVCPVAGNQTLEEHVDFAVVRIGRGPDGRSAAEAFGKVNLAPIALEPYATVFVPQHPWTLTLRGDLAPLGDRENATQFRHRVTTYNMSSGSPIIAYDDAALIGVHYGGGVTCQRVDGVLVEIGCTNTFTTIEAVAERSPIIRALRAQVAAVSPEAPALPGTVIPPVQVRQSVETYAALLQRAQNGDARANWILGVKAEYADSPTERRLLGVENYLDEPSRSVDNAEAVARYRRAALLGYVPAMVDLGSFYFFGGPVVAQDRQRAVALFEDAAAQGDGRASSWLEHIYRSGDGVPQDLAKSLVYLRQAAERDDPRGLYFLGQQMLYGDRLVPMNEAEAVRLLQKSADGHYAPAQLLLADQYFAGRAGLPRDLSRARALYLAALSGGATAAEARLEQLALIEGN